MGNIITFCFCSACTSLLTSCCGSDKDSNIPPSATSGRKRSVFLLMLSIGIAFSFQYVVAPAFLPDADRRVSQNLVDAWSSGCEDFDNADLQLQCSGHSGTYRAASSALLFFVLAAAAAYFKPTANREAWTAKIFLFLCLNVVTLFIPNEPLFSLIMVNIFRVGAVFFIILQQIIFVDVAHNLNESWVAKADKADLEEGEEMGKKWLVALLTLCALLFTSSIVAIGLLFRYFGGCGVNIAFITVTLLVGLISTVIQLFGEEASLLASACVFSYATYLCYVSVSQNPNMACNPALADSNAANIVIGVGLTVISLLWTGWSYTAGDRVGEKREERVVVGDEVDRDIPINESVSGIVVDANETQVETVSGIVLETDNYGSMSENEESTTDTFSLSWKLNIMLCLITCWYAVALTAWGVVEIGSNSANPSVGRVSMWMITSSQWLMQMLYLWTLTAPRLFPDRDFS